MNKNWIILRDECEYWKLNQNENRRANEGKWYKAPGQLPLRYYNLKYALQKCNNDLMRALKYAKEHLFDVEGKPVYLPDELAYQNGVDPAERIYNYSKILKD